MSEKLYRLMSNDSKQLYCIESVDGEMFSMQEVVDLLNELNDENEQLRLELDTHKHPLWSTREAERKLSEVTDNLADEVRKNGVLNEEINQLRIENMRLKKRW